MEDRGSRLEVGDSDSDNARDTDQKKTNGEQAIKHKRGTTPEDTTNTQKNDERQHCSFKLFDIIQGVAEPARFKNMSTPGVEPGLSRPQRDVLTTRRCGRLMLL